MANNDTQKRSVATKPTDRKINLEKMASPNPVVRVRRAVKGSKSSPR